jgi:hypothetical protein
VDFCTSAAALVLVGAVETTELVEMLGEVEVEILWTPASMSRTLPVV